MSENNSSNPWKEISVSNPVAVVDQDFLRDHNRNSKGERYVSEEDLPEPFIGSANASILILMGSPGEVSDTARNNPLLNKNILFNLKNPWHKESFPFYPLKDEFSQLNHGKWWNRVFNVFATDLSKDEGLKEYALEGISNTFFNLELYGYHSKITHQKFLDLPSSKFNIRLIEKAMAENKIILIPRARRNWFRLVDGLSDYPFCYFVASNRGIEINKHTLSPLAYKKVHSEVVSSILRIKTYANKK
ncbi:MAG: hypothetical protein COB15_16760 [Flavobacteriales bacterium]|nr:MAG: hypothetical protein COB15_16760 [Flavobacteriales bacterium]